jgi:uncharacterized protein YggE
MKKVITIICLFFVLMLQAQEGKAIPQISVSGEGIIKIAPDQVFISVTTETKGSDAADVKKRNDIAISEVIKFIKTAKIPTEDVQTKRISLNPEFDYQVKKRNYNATQTIEILLKDITKYDSVIVGLIDAGINRIDVVEFRSSKLEQYLSEARKLAIKQAKQKAEDFAFTLGQKVGKALNITDNSQGYFPQPMYDKSTLKMGIQNNGTPRETIAIGEINISANVNVSFVLE